MTRLQAAWLASGARFKRAGGQPISVKNCLASPDRSLATSIARSTCRLCFPSMNATLELARLISRLSYGDADASAMPAPSPPPAAPRPLPPHADRSVPTLGHSPLPLPPPPLLLARLLSNPQPSPRDLSGGGGGGGAWPERLMP